MLLLSFLPPPWHTISTTYALLNHTPANIQCREKDRRRVPNSLKNYKLATIHYLLKKRANTQNEKCDVELTHPSSAHPSSSFIHRHTGTCFSSWPRHFNDTTNDYLSSDKYTHHTRMQNVLIFGWLMAVLEYPLSTSRVTKVKKSGDRWHTGRPRKDGEWRQSKWK